MAYAAPGLSRNGGTHSSNAGCILSTIAIACGLGFFGYCYHAWQETGDRMEREAIQERTAEETRYAKAVSDLRAKPPRVLDDIVRVAGDPFDCYPAEGIPEGLPGRTECRWAFSPTAHHLYSWTEGSKLGSRVVGFRPEP